MKKKIVFGLLLAAVVAGTIAEKMTAEAFACGTRECPGGNTQCCRKANGDTYFNNRASGE